MCIIARQQCSATSIWCKYNKPMRIHEIITEMDPSRRGFLKTLGKTAMGVAGAAALGALPPGAAQAFGTDPQPDKTKSTGDRGDFELKGLKFGMDRDEVLARSKTRAGGILRGIRKAIGSDNSNSIRLPWDDIYDITLRPAGSGLYTDTYALFTKDGRLKEIQVRGSSAKIDEIVQQIYKRYGKPDKYTDTRPGFGQSDVRYGKGTWSSPVGKTRQAVGNIDELNYHAKWNNVDNGVEISAMPSIKTTDHGGIAFRSTTLRNESQQA